MQIVNDHINDDSKIFPGDNWFFYWKTSSALWPEKLREFKSSKVIVPINWAFHTDNGKIFDFNHEKPETNLKILEKIAHEAGKELVFFIPITPVPFISGGGLPHALCRISSISREGFQVVSCEATGIINKIYSYYDQRVFIAYRQFLKALGTFFSESEMSSNLWAMDCGVVQDEQFISYLEDHSSAFKESFERFLGVKKTEMEVDQNIENKPLISSTQDEDIFVKEFASNIRQLYCETVKEFFPVNYEGIVRIAFLGGAMDDLLIKLVNSERQNKYSKDILSCLTMNIIPSSILLSKDVRDGLLEKQFSDLVGSSYLNVLLGDNLYDIDEDKVFVPLTFFYLYHRDQRSFAEESYWDKIGFSSFLKHNSNWSYKVNNLIEPLKVSDELNSNTQIHFFLGSTIDNNEYYYILKLFMNGRTIIIDNTELADKFAKKFEMFFIENSIDLVTINKTTNITVGTLGDGQLLFFDGDRIVDLNEGKKHNFWSGVISTFEIIDIEIASDDGIDYLWKTRSPATSELSFEEVRRVYFYNPTSYKKKVRLHWEKNFAFLKINNEVNSKISNQSNQSIIEFLPMGSVSMDFGVF